MKQHSSRFQLLTMLVIGAALSFGGCGGGTKGTGGDQLTGLVLSRAQQPVANVQVTSLASGASATTDADGLFSIEDDFAPGNLDLGIETDRFSASVTVSNVPDRRARIRVVIELDEDLQEARLRRETIEGGSETEFARESDDSREERSDG